MPVRLVSPAGLPGALSAGLVEATLPRAQQAGLVDAALTFDDVMLAWRMVFGVAVTTVPADLIRPAVERALSLLHLG